MQKEPLIMIEKVWGEEIWLVNCPEYCGKLLLLDRDAESSYHLHNNKKETFMSIEGYAKLIIEGKEYILAPFTRAKTIFPGEKHRFIGLSEAVILEVSTHHDESDVIRFDNSKPGKMEVEYKL